MLLADRGAVEKCRCPAAGFEPGGKPLVPLLTLGAAVIADLTEFGFRRRTSCTQWTGNRPFLPLRMPSNILPLSSPPVTEKCKQRCYDQNHPFWVWGPIFSQCVSTSKHFFDILRLTACHVSLLSLLWKNCSFPSMSKFSQHFMGLI